MSTNRLFLKGFVWLAAGASLLQAAENVLVLPGAGSSASQIPVYTTSPFQVQTTITTQSIGGFQVLSKPDGTKNYIISSVGSTAVSVYDGNFNNGRVISGQIPLAPVTAALSPDGRRLVVLASSVYIFDTATDTILNSGGTNVNGNLVDVAFSVDSSQAFVLSNNASFGIVTPIDLSNYTSGTALTLPGAGAGIALSPGGLLYVTTLNRLFELDPRTLAITPSGTIPVNGNPGKPAFTPDGKYALAVNRTTVTGSSLMLFDLTNHTLSATFPSFGGVTLDRLVVAGNNKLFAASSQNSALYDVTVQSGVAINPSSVSTAIPSSITSFAVSNELPARSIYAIAQNNGQTVLYKVDLSTLNTAGQFSLPNVSGQVVGYVANSQTSGATTITAYNATQVVQPGAKSLPLVARVQDSLGRPVNGARVDFATTTAGAALTAASAFTNSDGYAQTYLTAPNVAGAVTVTAASTGTAGATYTLTVPGVITGGGGGGSTLAAITIVSGNGQILPDQYPTSQNLVVQLTDANGNPAPNQTVVFSITQGGGTIPGFGTTFTTTTDVKGQASIPFTASTVDPGFSFQQTTINAASAVGSVNFTLTTVARTLDQSGTVAAGAYILKPDLTLQGRIVSGGAGAIVKGAIQVQVIAVSGPQSGQPIPNVALNVGPVSGDDPTKLPTATCANTALSDANGIASCDVLLGNVLGTNSIAVNVGNYRDLTGVLVQITVGPPSIITKTSGDTQSGAPGTALPQPLRIHITDSAKNTLPNIPLKWTVTKGAATFTSTSTQTDASGNGSTNVTLGNTPGTVTITVTAGTGSATATATFNLTVTVNIATLQVVSGNSQNTGTGQAFLLPLVVVANDDKGQPVVGTPVTWAVSSGPASLSQTTVNTDALGQSSVTATAGSSAGPVVITATAGGLTVTFNLTSRLPGPPVNTTSFVNAASGATGLTPCGIALAQASGLVPGVQGVVEANLYVGPLPTTLSGASISVNGIAAPLFWVSSGAIAFQTPCETQAGTATVVVTVSGGTTTVQGVNVAATQPGLFETTFNGRKFAVLLHADGSYVTPDSPAKRGEQLKMFGTGLGPVTAPTATGRAGTGGQTVNASITVGVNNGGVRLISAEYMAGAVGIYVITFEVPADTQTGPAQNLALAVAGPDGNLIFGNGSFVPIQ